MAQAENDDRTIVRQRDAYGREYDIAVRYFPDDDIANINASSAALVRGDLELAWVCLGRVRENPLAANNLGVYHWLREDRGGRSLLRKGPGDRSSAGRLQPRTAPQVERRIRG